MRNYTEIPDLKPPKKRDSTVTVELYEMIAFIVMALMVGVLVGVIWVKS